MSDGNRLSDDTSRIIVLGLEKISRLVPAPALLGACATTSNKNG